MAGNPPREDPGPPYVATLARSGASRMCPLSSSLHKLGAHLHRERSPTSASASPPRLERAGACCQHVLPSHHCPGSARRSPRSLACRGPQGGKPAEWCRRAWGGQESWGLLLQRRGDRAHDECGGHAVPSHLALRLPIPQPQQFSWPCIGQELDRRAASGQDARRLNLLHYPIACAEGDAASR